IEYLATNQAVGGSNPPGRATYQKASLCEAFFVSEKQTLTTYSLVCAVKVGFVSYLIELQCHFAYLVNHL
ncbi:hypothetical protein, partial [Vibrio parahaemolyticus]|uniref:hypothetical protein n=3 Tax=Vibrio parahaemolyticus TaxID=670 RepID=UPI00116A5261